VLSHKPTFDVLGDTSRDQFQKPNLLLGYIKLRVLVGLVKCIIWGIEIVNNGEARWVKLVDGSALFYGKGSGLHDDSFTLIL